MKFISVPVVSTALLPFIIGASSAFALPATGVNYQLSSGVSSSKCIDVQGDSAAAEATFVVNDCSSPTGEVFQLKSVSGSSGYEVVMQTTGLCMGVQGASTGYSIPIDQETCSGAKNQIWSLNAYESSYELVNANSNMCLDLNNGNVTDGNNLKQYGCFSLGSNPNQLWTFVAVSGGATPTPTPTLSNGVTVFPVTSVTAVPGATVQMTYEFQATNPTSSSYQIFVQFLNSSGTDVFDANNYPVTPTTSWNGNMSYVRPFTLPSTMSPGTYKMVVGLYNSVGRLKLNVGSGVTAMASDSYQVGTLTVVPNTSSLAVSINPNSTSTVVGSTFAGFSYEKAYIPRNFFTSSNSNLIGLFKAVGPGILRIGGSSTDQCTWNSSGPGLVADQISPADIDRLGGFLKAAGWTVIYNINLVTSNPTLASEEVAYVTKSLGSSLQDIVIGNEPDGYHEGLEPSTYDYADYLSQIESFSNAIKIAEPSFSRAGPDAASNFQGYTVPFAHDGLPYNLKLVTQHYYYSTGAATNSLQMLLLPDAWLSYQLQLIDQATVQNKDSQGFRFDEANSFFEPGTYGDEFGTALWALDFLFTNATFHSTGVNFHGGGNVDWTPIIDDHVSQVTGLNPLYYAIRLFSMAAKGNLTAVSVSPQKTTFTANAISNSGGIYLILNNKDTSAVTVKVSALGSYLHATSTLLTASTLESKTGFTLGGTTISTNGTWSGSESVLSSVASGSGSSQASVLTTSVPAGSALMVHLTH